MVDLERAIYDDSRNYRVFLCGRVRPNDKIEMQSNATPWRERSHDVVMVGRVHAVAREEEAWLSAFVVRCLVSSVPWKGAVGARG